MDDLHENIPNIIAQLHYTFGILWGVFWLQNVTLINVEEEEYRA